MDTNLYQHRLFEKRWVFITDTGLEVRYKNFIKVFEYETKFENVGTKIIHIKKGKTRLLVISLVLILLSVILFIDRVNGGNVEKGADIFYMIPGLLLFGIYLISFENSKYLVQPGNLNGIKFINNKSNKAELDLFLDTLLNKRKACLLEKYGEINKNLSYETQYHNLVWLKDVGVLNDLEFTEKKKELEQILRAATIVKGFGAVGSLESN